MRDGIASPSEALLGIVAFAVGAGVMAVELTASRLLAPYFGASFFVWTSLIVTVLFALSVGYWVGGIASAKDDGVRTVGYLLCGAAVLLLAGLAVAPTFSVTVVSLLADSSSATTALFLGSLAVSAFVFAAPVFMLAAVGPILLKAWSAKGDVGRMSGRYFAVSTVGSVLGTVAPTLWLVPTFGARHSIQAVAIAFLLLGAALLKGRVRLVAPAVVLALVAYTEVSAKAAPAELVMERESPYQLIRVFGDGDRRYLTFNEGAGIQSVYDPSGSRLGMYYDYFGLVPFVRPPGPGGQDVAVIGLAGGTAVRQYGAIRPGTYRFTGVEVDEQVIDVARREFGLDGLGIDVVNEDGRMFLSSTDKRFDVIIVDAYSVQLYIPAHLATEEFFGLVKSRLKPGGILVMNVNAAHDDSPLLKALGNAVASAFSDVRVVPLPEAWNRIVLAGDVPFNFDAVSRELPEPYADMRDVLAGAYRVTRNPDGESFTDDRAPVEFLTDAMIVGEAARRR